MRTVYGKSNSLRGRARQEGDRTQQASISPSLRDLERAAGFLEGEGNFRSTNRGSQSIRASQVNPEPLAKLLILFGGSVYKRQQKKEHQSPYWDWQAHGARARGIMMTLYPLMSVVRKTQIATALQKGLRP